jgi:methylenetetrahydrofolate--tRNA-(uracil-5-)-methyltransferase
MEHARQTAVPAGHALAVDRLAFARAATAAIEREPLITVHREEVAAIDEDSAITIVASGPLTSDGLAHEIERLAAADDSAPTDVKTASVGGPGAARLYFYDSISPIVEADSIDAEKVYRAARYDKGSADYINCPMNQAEYNRFLDGLIEAQIVEGPAWETIPTDAKTTLVGGPKLNYFEGCLPIEEIARRGRDTLRFGPMKPVGLRDPRSGKIPYAVVQLRQENLRADSYNLVGFQNHLRFGEQARVLRLIPGLENARFLRYGQIHRNTYINAPALLLPTLQMKRHPRVLFAGQISGVEGYVESMATGQLAGIAAAALAAEQQPLAAPRPTALGSLVHYICYAEARHFQPANITFDLLEPLDEATRQKIRDKKVRHQMVCERALVALQEWLMQIQPRSTTAQAGLRDCGTRLDSTLHDR